jgi:hypothetical protein
VGNSEGVPKGGKVGGVKIIPILGFFGLVLVISGCSRGPAPPVALAYADQYGAVESSRFTACPKIQGVWRLANLSGGSVRDSRDGRDDLVPHLRWFAPKLFDLSVGTKSYIAIERNSVETVFYLSDNLPLAGGRKSLGYSVKTEKEIPCVGYGWRQVATTDHTPNDAVARVLKIIPEKPKKIVQTDYVARNGENELILAIRVDYQGVNQDQEPVNSGYWHFLKMPRLHESPKEQGFQY